ncbi:AAA family ATPase [Bacillus niameyensis]|uniref:AAA family ATPase n=1 Tax=Bacillus niameyensis TaxID=1522308 RepID=UPI000780DE9E|nr:AAA family ATPase [Bacillus niameyensis]
MKFILIFGPQAVGKMTIGQELAKITELKLFHNHMSIELVSPIFGFGAVGRKLSNVIREEVFKAAAQSDLYGLIFTYVWAFDQKADWEYVDKVCTLFESNGGTVYFVELEADVDERLQRNKGANRLEHKPTKRNIDWSEQDLLTTMNNHRLNSLEGEITKEDYLRINNTNLTAGEVARMIKKEFRL